MFNSSLCRKVKKWCLIKSLYCSVTCWRSFPIFHSLYLNLFSYFKSAKATADRKSMSKPGTYEGDLRGQATDISERIYPQEVELGSSQSDCMISGNDSEEPLSAHMSRKTAISQFEGKALGLDKAILHSIDCCGKKYVCIILSNCFSVWF